MKYISIKLKFKEIQKSFKVDIFAGIGIILCFMVTSGFPHSSVGKISAYNAGDLGSVPGSGKIP